MLAFVRQQPWMDKSDETRHMGEDSGTLFDECTLGVVGVGNIGKAVLRRGRAFGMRLLGTDIIEIAPDFIRGNEINMTPLKILNRSDFVSLTAT